MRIGTRLLLVNLAVVLAAGLVLAVLTPFIARQALLRTVARAMANQANRLGRVQLLRPGSSLPRETLAVTAYEALVVDPNLQVVRATRAWEDLEGRPLPPELIPPVQQALATGYPVAIPRLQLPGAPARVAGVAPIRLGTRAGAPVAGAVVLAQPVGELFDPEGRWVERAILLLTLGGVLLTAAASAVISRTLVARIKEVAAAAHAMAGGHLETRVPARGQDEISDLAQSFNHMAERIAALVGGLRESERLRRDLMAAIAHELRTPVTSIRGFAEALRDGVVPEDRRARYYEIMVAESARLARLIQDLFDLAKLDAGQLEMRMQPMDLAAWLQQFTASQRHRLERAGLELVVHAPPDPVVVLADQDRLEQVLDNLMDNAARYAPPDSAITVELAVAGGEARVSVTDQGPGLPPEEAEHVWERFYQGKDPGRRKGGAGLGLAIVKSIVTAHGGRVGVDPRPGEGARFWFALPLAPSPRNGMVS